MLEKLRGDKITPEYKADLDQKRAPLEEQIKTLSEMLSSLETEKAEVEMEALDEGVLVEVVHGPGDEVPVGGLLGYLEPG